MSRPAKLIFGWLIILLISQAHQLYGSGFTVDKWTTDEGLPQNSVISIAQSRDGYLWLGTLNGLVRFDGIRFKVFDESNTPGLTDNRIIKVFEDSDHNLWLGTETAGVVLVNNKGKVTPLDIGRGSRTGRLLSATEDRHGSVWLYTADGQLCRYNNGRVDIWNVGAGTVGATRVLAGDDQGLLWVASDWNLAALDPAPAGAQGLVIAKEVQIQRKLEFILSSRKGGHWEIADGQVVRRKNGSVVENLGSYPWTPNVGVATACEDVNGNLVVGTYGEGVFWHDGAGKWMQLKKGLLSHNFAISLAFDREGSLWVGTDGGGLNRVKKQVFQTLASTLDWTVQSIAEDKWNRLWLGVNGGGAACWTGSELVSFTNHEELPNLYVRSVLVDADQRLWAGTYGGGLLQFDAGKFIPAPGMELLDPHVSVLYQDRQSRVWAGTQNGLGYWDGRQWEIKTNAPLNCPIQAITQDLDGNIWVGTSSRGLFRLRQGNVDAFTRTNGLPHDHVTSLICDKKGVIYVGTVQGLGRFANGRWTSVSKAEGLAANYIGYLLDDETGCLWLGSNAGLMRVAKQELDMLASGATNEVYCRAYTKPDGLPTGECTQGSQPAACRTAVGHLWFPTIKGVVEVDPKQIVANTNPPPVLIEMVFVDGRPQMQEALRVPSTNAIVIPAGKEMLDIEYASLNLAAPEKGRFKFRMGGFEKAWNVKSGLFRTAHYPKLPPGDYVFEVLAANEDGVWNDQPATLQVRVLPPFWRTWWFLTGAGLLLVGLLIAIVHLISTQRLQRQLAELRQKEALEKERARIARDIHDQVGASLTQVSLIGEMLEADKDQPEEVESHARQISQTALETTRALDEIVWTVNPSNDTLDALLTYICKYAQDYLGVAGLKYRLEVPEDLPNTPITPELRHNVFLAAKEAITNVVKHAKASAAIVRLSLEPNRFTLEIEDNGKGLGTMNPEAAARRNGLRNMRKRMEDVGGSFAFESAPSGGAIVRLSAPVIHH